MRSAHTSKQCKTSPANYTPNVRPAASKAVASGPKVTKVKKMARRIAPNLVGAEMASKMGAATSVNREIRERQQRRMKQGL